MHSMTKRYAFYGKRAVFIYYLLLSRVNGMEDNLKVESATEGFEFKVQKFLIFAGSIYVEWGSTTVKSERAYHSHQTENMISVKMGNENSINLCKVKARFPYLLLGALSTVNHKEFSPYLHNL